MKITDDMVHAACNAYDDHLKGHDNVFLRGVATGHGMKAASKAAIQAAWVKIEVNGRFPNMREHVLVLDSYEGYHVAVYNKEYDMWNSVCEHQLYNVISWMQLPGYKE
jgi:hypothetical protein